MDLSYRNRYKLEDLEYLNELLKSNLSFKICLGIIKSPQNEKITNSLLEELDSGKTIDEVIYRYLPIRIVPYLKSLMKNLSFQKSLELALSFIRKTKENIEKLRKDLTYPLVLIFVSMTALFLFDAFGLDTIINMLKGINTNPYSINVFRVILRGLIYIFYTSLLFLLIMTLYFLKPKRITLFYILVCKYLKGNFLKIYFTEEFVSLFIITSKFGYHTKESLEILKSLDNKPIISFMAFHIDDELLGGLSLKEATSIIYFDPMFCKFINIASYTNNFTGILENYVSLSLKKIKNKTAFYTKVISAISYLVIGIMVIFVYQVLFLPMRAISNF